MTKRKVARSKPDYTRNKAGCLVYTIECVLSHDVATEEMQAVSDAVEGLQHYGSAEIVQVDHVSESWDDACKILRQRMVQ